VIALMIKASSTCVAPVNYQIHGASTQKTAIFILVAVITSDFTKQGVFFVSIFVLIHLATKLDPFLMTWIRKKRVECKRYTESNLK
jgi:hypothetical protein